MGDKTSFPWPGMMSGPSDNSNAFLGHDLAIGSGSDTEFATNGGSRSMTGSPPRHNLTPEQREIRRQMDQARRGTKSATRYRRSGGSPYLSAADATAPGVSMPVYTSSMAPISLLARPATSIPQPSYLSAPYSHQTLEPDTSGMQTSSMYSTSAPHQQHPQQPPPQHHQQHM